MTEQADVIVVAVDFEKASLKALEVAKELAKTMGAEVVIAHVYQVPMFTYPGLEPALLPTFTTEISAAAKRAVEELSAKAGGLRSVLREGEPSTELLAIANEVKAKMLVMGTHGRSGIAHLFLGSVAEKVMRHSTIPVLTVRAVE